MPPLVIKDEVMLTLNDVTVPVAVVMVPIMELPGTEVCQMKRSAPLMTKVEAIVKVTVVGKLVGIELEVVLVRNVLSGRAGGILATLVNV